MNESILSYFNLIRCCPYPVVPTGGAGFNLPAYGHVPTTLNYTPAPAFPSTSLFTGTRLATGTHTSGDANAVPFAGVAGWAFLPGLKSADLGSFDFTMVNVGHQLSPGMAAQMAPGEQQPFEITVTFTHSAAVLADLWALSPGGVVAPRIPVVDDALLAAAGMSTTDAAAYRALSKGRLLFDLITPEGAVLRTLGALSLPSPFTVPDQVGEMTVQGAIKGSGRPILFTPAGTVPG